MAIMTGQQNIAQLREIADKVNAKFKLVRKPMAGRVRIRKDRENDRLLVKFPKVKYVFETEEGKTRTRKLYPYLAFDGKRVVCDCTLNGEEIMDHRPVAIGKVKKEIDQMYKQLGIDGEKVMLEFAKNLH